MMNNYNNFINQKKNLINIGTKLSDFEDNIAPLGQGNYGIVVKMKSKLDNLYYAVKRIYKEDLNKKNFTRETEILKKLNHENIINFYGYFEEIDSYFLVFEYAQNGSLNDYIQKYKSQFNSNQEIPPFKEDFVIKIFKDILNGLKYLHNKNILHRDIKPDNILLDENMTAKITDFGISAIYLNKNNNINFNERNTLVMHNTIIGHKDFIPPELINGDKYDFKIDIFSLGLTIFNLMSFNLPYNSTLNEERIERHINGNIINQLYSLQLRNLIMQMINENPKNRPNAFEAYDFLVMIEQNIKNSQNNELNQNYQNTNNQNNNFQFNNNSNISNFQQFQNNQNNMNNQNIMYQNYFNNGNNQNNFQNSFQNNQNNNFQNNPNNINNNFQNFQNNNYQNFQNNNFQNNQNNFQNLQNNTFQNIQNNNCISNQNIQNNNCISNQNIQNNNCISNHNIQNNNFQNLQNSTFQNNQNNNCQNIQNNNFQNIQNNNFPNNQNLQNNQNFQVNQNFQNNQMITQNNNNNNISKAGLFENQNYSLLRVIECLSNIKELNIEKIKNQISTYCKDKYNFVPLDILDFLKLIKLNLKNKTDKNTFTTKIIEFRDKLSSKIEKNKNKNKEAIVPKLIFEKIFNIFNEDFKNAKIPWNNTFFNKIVEIDSLPLETFPEMYNKIKKFKKEYKNPFVDISYFLSLDLIRCPDCNDITNADIHIDYSMHIPSKYKGSVGNMIKDYMALENSEEKCKCSQCYYRGPGKKEKAFYATPKYLIIDFEVRNTKVNSFEETLDLSKYLLTSKGPKKYSLFALINKENNDKYIGFIKNENGWIFCSNEDSVEKCSFDSLNFGIPYIAIYKGSD